MPERLLDTKEVACYLGIREKDVKNLVAMGKLPAYKIGGAFLRFKFEQVDALKNTILPASFKSKDVSLLERLADFLRFNDFYIISIIIAIGLLLVILYF
ncbi:MAG: hypothetical protein COS99_02250 [Candidatus Omnitrophica bacterium CG07_land_8_20_14_0_80_42_15]|uniref:Helix-turn-helix domain-containing protein n=1 Tax=Candidatus Aquitaenariimonas noxiae TaxID=1974741 RepID=A0A2J0L034_9BACT|nr:MAG: hypothetical protein COS99_02250 [Candidatus Omnitrophica bacterium CG07_land_8_20_14_0_80_42_15]